MKVEVVPLRNQEDKQEITGKKKIPREKQEAGQDNYITIIIHKQGCTDFISVQLLFLANLQIPIPRLCHGFCRTTDVVVLQVYLS